MLYWQVSVATVLRGFVQEQPASKFGYFFADQRKETLIAMGWHSSRDEARVAF